MSINVNYKRNIINLTSFSVSCLIKLSKTP